MKRTLLIATLALAGLSLGACAGGAFYVSTAPPPPRVYGFVGTAPGPGFVWLDGYWGWVGGNWRWVDGRWARPPRRGAIWVPPAYEPYGGRYRYRAGHWR